MPNSSFAIINILLVEDNIADARLLIESLKTLNIPNKITHLTTGEQAISYIKEIEKTTKPDIVILDLNLPGIDGREVLIHIKNNDKTKHIPTIIFSTSQSEKDIDASYANYANCFITKPLEYKDFEKVVKEIESFWFNTASIPR